MHKRFGKLLSGILLGIAMVALALATARATVNESEQWSTADFFDFRRGTMYNVDIWSQPGSVQLDHAWWPNAKVNDSSLQGKLSPSLSFALSETHGTSVTHFLAVWEDERNQDHYPDVMFAYSTDGGRSWSSDVQVGGAHVHNRRQNTPDITVRAEDESFWVLWQDNRRDDGDIFYATSADRGSSWSSATPVYTGTGAQRRPRVVPHGSSGYVFAVWEDEQSDGGDVYVSRHNPDELPSWSAPLKVNDDTSGAEQRNPELTVDVSGNLYVVWEDLRDNNDGEVYFSRWISGTAWDASSWSADARLSDPTMDWAGDPDVVAGPSGVLYAAWMERVPTGPATYDFQIVAARSLDQGENWNRTIVRRLYGASTSNASYSDPSIGVDLGERVYVAWIHSPDQQAATSNVLFSISPDQSENWTEPRILNTPRNKAVLDDPPALIVDFSGQLVVAWQDYRDPSIPEIYAAGYPSDRYLTLGQYNSEVFDAAGPAAWGTITWTATITPHTELALATRVMTQAGAAWTEWVTHTATGEALSHPSARFIQFRALFTSTGSNTPALEGVVISYQQYRLFLPLVSRDS